MIATENRLTKQKICAFSLEFDQEIRTRYLGQTPRTLCTFTIVCQCVWHITNYDVSAEILYSIAQKACHRLLCTMKPVRRGTMWNDHNNNLLHRIIALLNLACEGLRSATVFILATSIQPVYQQRPAIQQQCKKQTSSKAKDDNSKFRLNVIHPTKKICTLTFSEDFLWLHLKQQISMVKNGQMMLYSDL